MFITKFLSQKLIFLVVDIYYGLNTLSDMGVCYSLNTVKDMVHYCFKVVSFFLILEHIYSLFFSSLKRCTIFLAG